MTGVSPRFKAPEWLILIGGCVFILMLAVSAFFEPDIRWLHFFQAWMYIATMWLGLRGNRWGYFIGVSAAGLWMYSTIFTNTFFINGLQQLLPRIVAKHQEIFGGSYRHVMSLTVLALCTESTYK